MTSKTLRQRAAAWHLTQLEYTRPERLAEERCHREGLTILGEVIASSGRAAPAAARCHGLASAVVRRLFELSPGLDIDRTWTADPNEARVGAALDAVQRAMAAVIVEIATKTPGLDLTRWPVCEFVTRRGDGQLQWVKARGDYWARADVDAAVRAALPAFREFWAAHMKYAASRSDYAGLLDAP